MKDFKTTLMGVLAGLPIAIIALLTAYNNGTFTGETGYHLFAGISIVLLGLFASDSKPTAQSVAPADVSE